MLKNLNKYKVILASKSPRRQELLKSIGVDFLVLTKDVDESYSAQMSVYEVASYLSQKKAAAFTEEELPENYLLITADTIVIVDNIILGKPKDTDDARRMLRQLSGKRHVVITGVSVRTKQQTKTFSVSSNVTFDILDNEDIDYYVDNFMPLDKAGSYGIQEWIGYVGVENVEGSYFNVMGLPTQKLYKVLKSF